MNKKIFATLLAVSMALTASVFSMAEYVACKDPNSDHVMTEWTEYAKNENGSSAVQRTCTVCGYVQKGVGNMDKEGGVATTRGIATTLSIDAPATTDEVPLNVQTGAIV